MNKLCIAVAIMTAMTVGGAAAQTNYMKAGPSEPSPATKSVPAKSTKKAPTISSKCQTPGTNKPSSC